MCFISVNIQVVESCVIISNFSGTVQVKNLLSNTCIENKVERIVLIFYIFIILAMYRVTECI